MSLLITGRRRASDDPAYPLPAATETAPYGPIVVCAIETPDGQGQTIHPSVIDMVAERGSPLGGYRWWQANTPWTNKNDSTENPIIVVSNDRINWTTPPGLVNPIEPWDGVVGYYNSDTELVWDPASERLICYWRWVGGSTASTELRAKTSLDGITWSATQVVMPHPSWSPGIVRRPDGSWLMVDIGKWNMATASNPLGPWTLASGTKPAGYDLMNHGAIRRINGIYVGIFAGRVGPTGAWVMLTTTSTNGLNWSPVSSILGNGIVEASVYRPTLTASTKPGWVDVWVSTGGPIAGYGSQQVVYTRFPLSALPA